ncbi:MAG TPA: hypothetical protein VKF36_07220 [Syntrophorhabdales bacterium]|nr:hypothetical protein [Syntrophorhabdales bacterium]
MKRFIWLSILSFVLLVSFGMHVQAQSKEVTEVVTTTVYSTEKILPLDEGRVRVSYEAINITLSDTGSGLFHGATSRVLGGFTAEKGKFSDQQAWGVYNLQNGDKVFFTSTGAGEMKWEGGGEQKAFATFTGGTGKCAGIKGTTTFIRYALRPAVEGIVQIYQKGTIKYTLP